MTPVRRDRAGSAPSGRSAVGAALPLRVRLVVVLVVLVGLGLVTAAAAAGSALDGYLVSRVDDQLVDESRRGRLGEAQGRGRGGGPGGRGPAEAPPGRFYIAGLNADGAVVGVLSDPGGGGSPDLSGIDLDDVDLAAREGGATRPRTVGSADGEGQWRVVVRPVSLPRFPAVTSVVYASDLGDVEGTTDRLRRLQTGVGAGVLVLVGVVGYLLVRQSLRPLVEVEEAASAVAAGDLSRRVPERDPRTEVGSLSASFNEMVEQVQSAFATRAASEERLRRFAADASHELRTPLTSIRGFAELYRQGGIPEADVPRAMSRIEGESVRMTSLVEDLLLLARLDQQRPLERSSVDLLALATDAVHDATALAGGRVVRLEVVGEQAPLVVGDEGKLRQVLANLVTNALTHTGPSATVTVRVGASGDSALLEVADDGPGLSDVDAARVFERFYRADASRTRGAAASGGSGGSGLGLSIVAAIVAAHGGTVDLETAPGAGATFRVHLPLA